jgi:hypothetical protein
MIFPPRDAGGAEINRVVLFTLTTIDKTDVLLVSRFIYLCFIVSPYISICVYVYFDIYIFTIYLYISLYTFDMFIYIFVYICIYVYICISICIFVSAQCDRVQLI